MANLLKTLPVAVAALLAAASPVGALDTESRISQLEAQMKQVRTETASGNYGAQTAAGRPEVDGAGFYLLVDVLYWRARVGGSEYALSDSSAAVLPRNGTMQQVNLGWDWGFRVGAGYNFAHDGWDANLVYTYYRTSDSDSVASGLGGALVPLRGSSVINDQLTNFSVGSFIACSKATSNSRLSYNNLDFTLGRNYYVSKMVSFRPNIGVQAAWIDLKQDTNYSGGISSFGVDNLGVHTVFVNDKQKFWGIGPRLGFEGKWTMGRGFSLFGNGSASILYGSWKVTHKNWFSADTTTNKIELNGDMHQFTTTGRLIIGLAYDAYIDQDKQHFGISLGYDTQYWWAFNQMLRVDREVNAARGSTDDQTYYNRYNADLGMAGVTLEVRWDF